jgi:hypothetical protein
MSIDLLERGAAALGPLVEQVAFVGGATIVLWITDPGAPVPRPTKDADVVVEVAAAADDVREFVAGGIGDLMDQPRFIDAIFGSLRPDLASQARGDSVVLPRLRNPGAAAAAGRTVIVSSASVNACALSGTKRMLQSAIRGLRRA